VLLVPECQVDKRKDEELLRSVRSATTMATTTSPACRINYTNIVESTPFLVGGQQKNDKKKSRIAVKTSSV
jgi:hypothetical protein